MFTKLDIVQTVFVKTVTTPAGDQHSATFTGPPATSSSMYKRNGDYFTNVVVPMNKPVMVYAYFATKPMSKIDALAEMLTRGPALYHDWLRTVVPAHLHPRVYSDAPDPLHVPDAPLATVIPDPITPTPDAAPTKKSRVTA